MRVRRHTNHSRLFIRCKSQKNEGGTHICEWIASLANGACHFVCPHAISSLCNQSEAIPQYKTPDSGEEQIPRDCSICTNAADK